MRTFYVINYFCGLNKIRDPLLTFIKLVISSTMQCYSCLYMQCINKNEIVFSEFLAPGAPCEINIDGKTMERTHKEMKIPSRFTFDGAAEHVYALLLKKDCYPRFIRSEHYKNLLANGVQPSARRR